MDHQLCGTDLFRGEVLNSIIVVIQVLLLSTAGFLVFYLFLLSILAAFVRVESPSPTTRERRFAVIVPAHNEEFTIIPTITSILSLDYPRNNVEAVVIADNCTDRTAEVARLSGATVMERRDTTLRGKGHALRWCFDQLLTTGKYDAFVVIDADSTIAPDFVAVMNRHLERGERVIQSADLVAPQPGAWSSEITRLGFTLYNLVRPLGRHAMGCSVGLRGNGMCFSTDIFRSHPWQAYTRTEDLEFGLFLLLHGIPVTFAPEARVLARMPSNPQLAQSQRARWEGGRFPVIKKYGPRLLKGALLEGSLPLLDSFIDLVTPPLINLVAMVIGILLVTAGLSVTGIITHFIFLYIWLCVVLLSFLHMFLGLYAARADKSLYRALLSVPRYVLWKGTLYARLAWRGSTKEWVRTTREPLAREDKHETSGQQTN